MGIAVGTTWHDSKGRCWSVYELLPFGVARVRCGPLIGEMRLRDIRIALAQTAGGAE